MEWPVIFCFFFRSPVAGRCHRRLEPNEKKKQFIFGEIARKGCAREMALFLASRTHRRKVIKINEIVISPRFMRQRRRRRARATNARTTRLEHKSH